MSARPGSPWYAGTALRILPGATPQGLRCAPLGLREEGRLRGRIQITGELPADPRGDIQGRTDSAEITRGHPREEVTIGPRLEDSSHQQVEEHSPQEAVQDHPGHRPEEEDLTWPPCGGA